MITIDMIFAKKNVRQATDALLERKGGAGPDGLPLTEIEDYWKANGAQIEAACRAGTYLPAAASRFEVVTGTGKRREVASINAIDRLIERMLHQRLNKVLDPLFSSHSFAYRPEKSTLDAAMLARSYIESGLVYVCEIDLKDYFTTLDLVLLEEMLSNGICDETVLTLIHAYLHREILREGKIEVPRRGVLQGSSMSPVLANFYLNPFDQRLDMLGLSWFRFSDNICVYFPTAEEASASYAYLTKTLTKRHQLTINERKSGVFPALSRRVLGYDLVQTEYGIEVRKHAYLPQRRHDSWYSSVVSRQDGVYHIVQDGVISRRDYSLIFQNDEERHHIPVEVTTQLNVYGNVTVTPEALSTMCQYGIRIAYVDRYGDMMGTFEPEGHTKSADVFLKQALLYTDEERRLGLARKLESANIHNMRANLRYYAKRGIGGMDACIAELDGCIAELGRADDVGGLMLIEARARRTYYATFAEILVGEQYDFTLRTRKPPRDRGNAMVSFGNVVLYNFVLQCIWRTSLDPKIGIIHATNRRSHSLNLDIADLFKPILVDRTIFAQVNKREMNADAHFVEGEGGGVLLSQEGKRAFLHRFQAKLDDVITRGGRKMTYRQLVVDEVRALQRHIADGSTYHPYKYY